MQAQTQSQPLFLEHWLRIQAAAVTRAVAAPAPPSGPTTALSILQAWTYVREFLGGTVDYEIQRRRLLESLQILLDSRSAIHIADPQAKLLVSLLVPSASTSAASGSYTPPPAESVPLVHRLLYIWVRKSNRPSPSLLDSAARAVIDSLPSPPSSGITTDTILLLGALSATQPLPDSSRKECLEVLCRSLNEGLVVVTDRVEDVLASIGYGLSRSASPYFGKLAALLLGVWNRLSRQGWSVGTLQHGLMVLGLVEWAMMGLIAARSLDKIEMICRELSLEKSRAANYAYFAVVTASAGVLRAFRKTNRVELNPDLRHILESSISAAAATVVSRAGNGQRLESTEHEARTLAECISLGLARCGPFRFNSAVMACICLVLLESTFPLSLFEVTSSSLDKIKEHLESALFKEAGAISGVLCSQYALANDEERTSSVENHMWEYTQDFYSKLRRAVLVLRGRNPKLLELLEKMAESIFLMVVVFASQVNKRKLDPKSSLALQFDVSVKILIAFSCIEYLRRVRWPEYTEVVRRAVLTLQENSSAFSSFIESIPTYDELINPKDFELIGKNKYIWCEDEVQTTRLLFYLRVIPTCIASMPDAIFRQKVAPMMFLYLCHPNVKVSRASHSVFAAFISASTNTDQDDKTELKEQLAFYYMQRSLEAFPGITPYEGFASGVAALVRHLPAGSPAIFYSISSLVEKANDVFQLAIKQDVDLWRNWDGESDNCKKIMELLLHLLSLVDIQVLPELLKLMAQLFIQLPDDGQKILLNEIHSKVAESDDVIRKPTLVSWVQSLSFLSSKNVSKRKGQKIGDMISSQTHAKL